MRITGVDAAYPKGLPRSAARGEEPVGGSPGDRIGRLMCEASASPCQGHVGTSTRAT